MKTLMMTTLTLISMNASASLSCFNPKTSNLAFPQKGSTIVSTDTDHHGEILMLRLDGRSFAEPMIFEQENIVVSSYSGPSEVYVATKNGKTVTLVIPKEIPEGKTTPAMVYATDGSMIIAEKLQCANESYNGDE